MIKRFESIKDLVRTDKQGEKVQAKDNSKDLASAVALRVRADLPRVLATYSVTTSEKPADSQYPKVYTECKSEPYIYEKSKRY